ncbi:asparaginase [Nocardiopsis sp. NRRL B-16309]|uniref:asparaginase n=1 Tax=Nocardiopsis sp. NRRL B-16309 TaxID=1519494 RepID=UPI0006AFFE63|nr:asparaginase [Nocardiopsis sp. NRRL B-16309]KOX24271.1 asparaginase [Nocardiopsis sp. NRRL B-16309]
MTPTALPEYVPLAEVIRSGMRESVHYGAVVGLSASGRVAHARGPVHQPMFPRSAAKPFQALAMLRAGAPLEGPSLAIAAGSHGGEDIHAARAERILAAAGLTPDALRCPADVPGGKDARLAFLRAGREPERLLMNCSGKHAGMLAACVRQGWSTEDYLDPAHPLQVLVRETIEDVCEEPVAHTAVDGCGAPQLAVTLAGLARGLWRMRTAPLGGHERAVVDAMSSHPEYVSGTGRIDTELMTRMPGLVSKVGADGVLLLGAATGETVAVKISDGDAEGRARTLVALDALRTLGVDVSPVQDRLRVDVLGGGAPVGEVRPL